MPVTENPAYMISMAAMAAIMAHGLNEKTFWDPTDEYLDKEWQKAVKKYKKNAKTIKKLRRQLSRAENRKRVFKASFLTAARRKKDSSKVVNERIARWVSQQAGSGSDVGESSSSDLSSGESLSPE